MGIDISKEKLNICLKKGTQTIREEEINNTVMAIKKCVKRIEKENCVANDDVLVCAEYTGRYIYPLVCACEEMELFLWMEDPCKWQIKNRQFFVINFHQFFVINFHQFYISLRKYAVEAKAA